jgi:Tol biopolymer transport system component
MSRNHNLPRMATTRITVLFILVLMALAAGIAADGGKLLVDTYGKLLLIGPDGSQQVLGESVIVAALSPDGRHVAFTRDENPRAFPNTSQILSVIPVAGGPAEQITKLPTGSHFGSVDWLPDGSAIAYEGKDGNLFISPISPTGSVARNLGPWYQGFSVSPDGSKIVHAVNSPATGLELLDVATGQRTLIHKVRKVVWSAKFSPDGQWIAYQITLYDPPRPKDDEPDCTPPTIGLRIYSMRTKTDTAVTIADAPKDWQNVKSFAWSPDSKRIALTLGTVDCDYPGSAGGVFITTIDLKSQVRASLSELAFEPAFSPDGKAVAFVDFSAPDSRARLIRYDLATGARTLIRRATDADNYYRLLGWK